MKNTIPLIVAILLGGLAVFAVSRMIRPKDADKEAQHVLVVAAARDITPKDGPIKDSWLMSREVEASSLPEKAILYAQKNRVIGQNTVRTISRNDYLLASDVAGMDIRLTEALGIGEWAVPVTFSDPGLIRLLQPGDEIAILGLMSVKDVVQKTDTTEEPEYVEHTVTSVLFPCVRVLDVGKGDAIRREENSESGQQGTIIVAMSPQEAAAIVAAQRKMELYPALRKSADTYAMRRRDVGIVTDATFESLKSGLEAITIPDNGGKDERKK